MLVGMKAAGAHCFGARDLTLFKNCCVTLQKEKPRIAPGLSVFS
jgi:hypothetical protein